MAVGVAGGRAEAQSRIAPDAIQAANDAAGTARVLAARVTPGDSLIITVEDDQLTSEALMAGTWRFGGLAETPRVVGRAIARAIQQGVSEQAVANVVVLDVAGTPPARVRLYYQPAALAAQ